MICAAGNHNIVMILDIKSLVTEIFIKSNAENDNMTNMSSRDNQLDDSISRNNLRGVNEALDALKQCQTGIHCLTVYPDLPSFRAIYSNYTKLQLEDNEIVLFLPYYETTDMVRFVLSGMNSRNDNVNSNLGRFSGIDVEKFEKEGSLIIRDSIKANVDSYEEQQGDEYNKNNTTNNMSLMAFLSILVKHATRRQKNGITIMLDMGLFHHSLYDHHIQRLEKFEATIPKKYDNMNLKVFCFYHQRDFERRFNQEQQATLLDYHGRNIMLISAID
jgi:hypothetical protein